VFSPSRGQNLRHEQDDEGLPWEGSLAAESPRQSCHDPQAPAG
jgi:hypothetical protein